MFRFAYPYVLYALLLIPAISLLFIFYTRWRKKSLEAIGDSELVSQLMPEASMQRPLIKFLLYQLALLFLIIGLARPQFGARLQEVKRKGLEIIVALDVSNSMKARDIQPNRLERAKQIISKLTDKLTDDKLGLIVFAGDAYTQIPITSDYVSAKMFLNHINTGMVPIQGTAIGKAIDRALVSYTPNTELQKVLIIITDGENHEDDAVAMAQEAANKKVIIYTMGMGLPEGAPIPEENSDNNFKKDRQGNVVVSKLDEVTLQKIAAATGGEYIRANNTQSGLNTLLDKVDKLSRQEYESTTYSDYDDQFMYFFAIAFIILILEALILDKKNKWLNRIKLFENFKM